MCDFYVIFNVKGEINECFILPCIIHLSKFKVENLMFLAQIFLYIKLLLCCIVYLFP